MIKIIDMDKLFDDYISDFVHQNIGKINAEEIENSIPQLYEKFGREKLSDLGNKSPEEFYKGYSPEELLEFLKAHLDKKVPVSDFLCETIQNDLSNEQALLNQLNQDLPEELTLYLVNMLDAMGSKKCANRYLEFITWDYSEPIKELATELLCNMADLVKDNIVGQFKDCAEPIKAYLTQVLSYASKDDKVFDILIEEFVKNQDNIPLYAGYLAKYGDERALPFLKTAIEGEKINYFDFEELRFAIEALGGEYQQERDFSADKIYQKIKQSKSNNKKV